MKYFLYTALLLAVTSGLSFFTSYLFALFFPIKFTENTIISKLYREGSREDYYYNPLTKNFYYIHDGNAFALGHIILSDADKTTFEVIYTDGIVSIAKDSKSLFFKHKRFSSSEIDLQTVKVLGFKSSDVGWLLEDKNSTYSIKEQDGTTSIELKNYGGLVSDVD
jgi:hypothetical protein